MGRGKSQKVASRFALAVGLSRYQNAGRGGLTELPFAAADAKAFAAALRELGWERHQIELLTDEKATLRNVEIAATGFPMWDIETALKRSIKARKVVVLVDACHAGGWGSLEARGLLMLQRGIHDLDTARALADRHPDKSWAWSLYGDCLLAANRPDDAALVYERALRLDPTTDLAQRVRHNLILALLRHGKCDEAARHLNEYLTLLDGPPDPDDHFLAYAQGDHRKALTEWRALPADRRSRLRQSVGDEALYVGFQTATWRRIRADCQASFRQPPPGTGPRRHAAPRVP